MRSDEFQRIHIFGANDQEFYFEFEMPLVEEVVQNTFGWDVLDEKAMAALVLPYTQSGPSWLRKEFIEKVGFND